MLIKKIVALFLSLRLTVVLLAFAIILVFVGTLAQVDEGLYAVQAHYFRQWLIFGAHLFGHKIPLILPGGYLIGTLLLVNLVTTHIYRFQLTPKKSASSLRTPASFCCSSASSRPICSRAKCRCTLPRARPRLFRKRDRLRAGLPIERRRSHRHPRRLLAQGGELKIDTLPFTIRVKTFWKNSDPTFRAPMMQNGPPLATNGFALKFDFQPVAETKTMDERNVPTALIELTGAERLARRLGRFRLGGRRNFDRGVRNRYAQQMGADMARKSPPAPPAAVRHGRRQDLHLRDAPAADYHSFR